VVLAVLCLIAAATFVNLRKSIWLDESLTLDRTHTSLSDTFRMAREMSRKPPLYFLVMYWWRKLDLSIEWARALSTLCMAGTLLALHGMGRTLRIGRGALQLAVMAALVPHFVWAAAEARVYAMTLFFLACSFLLFTRVWIVDTGHRTLQTVLFVLSGYAAILTFYYAGFVLAGLFAAGLLYPDRKRLVASGAGIGLLLVPQALPAVGHVQAQHGSYLPEVRFDSLWGAVQWFSTQLTEVMVRNAPVFSGDRRQVAFAAMLLGVVLLRLAWARGRLSREEWWALTAAAVSFLLLAALRIVNRTTVDTRHWIVVALPLLVVVALMASRVQQRWASTALLGGVTIVLAAADASFVRNERGPNDWRSAVTWVVEAQRPHEPIVAFRTNVLPIAYYYRGPNEIKRVPADSGLPPRQVAGEYQLPMPPGELTRLRGFLALASDTGRTFWILEGESRLHGPPILSQNLGQDVQVLERRQFHRVTAYRARLSAAVRDTTGVSATAPR